MRPDTKRKILDATIKLIEEKDSKPEDITVRDICRAAGVGLSQINYHFQTKENLIAQCVQVMIGDVIQNYAREFTLTPGMSAMDMLKRRMFTTLNFLYANENISRLSILTDHQNARRDDNTGQTVNAYLPLVEQVCMENNISDDPKTLMTLMVLTMQGMFLRTDVVREDLGLDLRSEDGRRQIIDIFVDNVFHKKAA
jgi:AcrR family transcriptional regulator